MYRVLSDFRHSSRGIFCVIHCSSRENYHNTVFSFSVLFTPLLLSYHVGRCTSSPCFNGGTCSEINEPCACPAGLSGTYCEIPCKIQINGLNFFRKTSKLFTSLLNAALIRQEYKHHLLP